MKLFISVLFAFMVAAAVSCNTAYCWTFPVEMGDVNANPIFMDTLSNEAFVGFSFYDYQQSLMRPKVVRIDTAGNNWGVVLESTENADLQALKSINGRILAIYTTLSNQGTYRIMVAEIQPSTGEVLSQTDVSGEFGELRGFPEIFGQRPASDTVYVNWSMLGDSVHSRYNILVFHDDALPDVLYPGGRDLPWSYTNIWAGSNTAYQDGHWYTQMQNGTIFRIAATDTVLETLQLSGPFAMWDWLFPKNGDSLVHIHVDYGLNQFILYHAGLDGQEISFGYVTDIQPNSWGNVAREDGFGNVLLQHRYAFDTTYTLFGCQVYTLAPNGDFEGFEFIGDQPYFLESAALDETTLALTYSRDDSLILRRFERSSFPLAEEEFLGPANFEFNGAYDLVSLPDGFGGCFVAWTRPITMSSGRLLVQHVGPLQTTSVGSNSSLSAEYVLNQSYPNPFNPSTTIAFDLPQAGPVKLTVYNISGQKVAELLDGRLSAGKHSVRFDGSQLSSGVYLYTLEAGSFIQTKKMILVK